MEYVQDSGRYQKKNEIKNCIAFVRPQNLHKIELLDFLNSYEIFSYI